MNLINKVEYTRNYKLYEYIENKYQHLNPILEVGKVYKIKENDWGTPCIYNDFNEVLYILSNEILNIQFKEFN